MGRATLRNVALAASWSCVAACSDDAQKPVQWQDVFHVVDSVTLSSDVLGQILGERGAGADLGAGWRAPFPGSSKMLRGPRQGERAAQFLVGLPREVGDVPYWPSWHRSVGAIGDATVFGASNFVYTIRQYTWEGTVLDSIAEAPSSWRPARLLPRGAFSDQNHDEMREYLKGATFIVGMAAVSDAMVVVAHGRYVDSPTDAGGTDEPSLLFARAPLGLTAATQYVNVYDRGARVVADAVGLGEIVGYGPGVVVFAKRRGDAYVLTQYAVS